MKQTKKSDAIELKNTYIFDQESAVEFIRLLSQDRFVSRAMGGACAGWPELPENARIEAPSRFNNLTPWLLYPELLR